MSQLEFNAGTGVVVPTTQEVREDIAAKVQAAFATGETGIELNVDPASPMGQVVDALTAEIEAKNAEIAFLANQFSMAQATGGFMDALASLYFIERKVSEATIVQCTCTGLAGTQIPYGAIVQDTNGNKYRCLQTTDTTIPASGSILVNFSAVEHGALAVQPNAVTKIVTTVPGWDTVNNPAAGIAGRDRESDAELLERVKASVAYNAHGTADALKAAIANLDGVIDCEVLENYGSETKTLYGVSVAGHSIAVCVSGGDDADIAEAIYRKKDAGCGMTGTHEVTYTAVDNGNTKYTYPIIVPTATNLYIRVTFFGSSMDETSQAAVKAAVVSDATGQGTNTRIGLASTVYGSRFWSTVLGVTNLPVKSIQLALGSASGFADSLQINANVEPVVSTATVSIVLAG